MKADTDGDRRAKREQHMRDYAILKDSDPKAARDHLVHAFHINSE